MRAIHLSDLDIATRVLLAITEADRATCARKMAEAAHVADCFRKRMRRRHPIWGDGTLAAAAFATGTPVPPARCDPAYRQTLCLLLRAIEGRASFDFHTPALYAKQACVSKDRTDGQYSGKTA